MVIDPRRTYYRLLQVDPRAETEIIALVYRKLAQRYHPDIDPSPEAAQRMRQLNEAHETLIDPLRRARYDALLAARRDRRETDRLIKRPGEVPYGEAGLPTGRPQGSVIDFGRYSGWTLGQIYARDPDFVEWLAKAPAGRQYRDEIRTMLGQRP